MMDYFLGHITYWIITSLMMVGLYTIMSRQNLVKKMAGLSIFQTAVILFYVSLGKVDGGTAPILADGFTEYSNPLPQVLMLTAIVVGVATTALGFALIVRIKDAYGDVEEEVLDDMDHQND